MNNYNKLFFRNTNIYILSYPIQKKKKKKKKKNFKYFLSFYSRNTFNYLGPNNCIII